MTFEPASGTVGTEVQVSATGLVPGAELELVWESAEADWNVDSAGGTFHGISAEETLTPVAAVTVDESGQAHFTFTVPEDYGYVHNTYLRDGEENVARQGFVVAPELTISPTSGPVGTPIAVRVTGVGYRFWESIWHLMYDGAHSGWASAITTGGTAEFVIPATGEVGKHTLQLMSGTHPVPYLNQQQSPNYKPQIPTVIGAVFEVTEGEAVLPDPVDEQGLTRKPFVAEVATEEAPLLTLDYASGQVGSDVTLYGNGFPAHSDVAITWSSVTGNRIDGGGWNEVHSDLVLARTDEDGNFETTFETPDDLGGEHTLTATVGDVSASTVYTITPSIVDVSPKVVAPGGDIALTIKGVGWTETANIYTLLLDNGYLGYGCGFNSQGDVTVHLKAPGTVGTHFITLYPSIYQGELSGPGAPPDTASANATYLQLPMLNHVDHPGEELPAFQLSFEVRE